MIGAIVGDIVGSIYEFDNHKSKDFELFSKDAFFTDDTVMTCAVAKTLVDLKKDLGANDCLMSAIKKDNLFKKLLVKNMHVIGRKHPLAGYGGRFFEWIFRNKTEPYNSYGNGSAMRVSPVAYVLDTLDSTSELARLSAEVTHNHKEGLKGAQVTAEAIFLARKGASKQDLKEHFSKYYDINFTLDEIRANYKFNETCQGSCPQAYVAFLESNSFEDALRNAISIGGDSDTIGAIAGSIAEAYYGITNDVKYTALSYLDDYLLDIVEDFERYFRRENSIL